MPSSQKSTPNPTAEASAQPIPFPLRRTASASLASGGFSKAATSSTPIMAQTIPAAREALRRSPDSRDSETLSTG